ncbi:MAG: hypothetical protein ABIS36_00650 [Chryseolinea sp.]
MDSSKIWIYLIIAAGYFISQVVKQRSKKAATPPNPTQRVPGKVEPVNQPKAVSFEELLREITQSKRPPSQRPVIDYDDEIENEERDLEDVNYDYRKGNPTVASYEAAKREAFVRPSLEETMKNSDTVVSFGKFKEFEKGGEKDLASEFLKDFKDPDGLRKAFVMSEILKPKF